MALFLDVDHGETIVIGGSRITLQKKSGTRARLRIDSEEEVHLDRGMQGEGAPAPDAPEPSPQAAPDPAGDNRPRPLLTRPALR